MRTAHFRSLFSATHSSRSVTGRMVGPLSLPTTGLLAQHESRPFGTGLEIDKSGSPLLIEMVGERWKVRVRFRAGFLHYPRSTLCSSTLNDVPPTRIRNTYYVKLGKGGEWETSSIQNGLLRIGWPDNPLSDINAGVWTVIEGQLRTPHGHRGTATRDLNALREIATSTEEDVWITFHSSSLWWCRLASGPVEEDSISKFRRTFGAWSDRDAHGRRLLAAEIPGEISQLQGFRGTVCRVKAAFALRRLLNAEKSPAYNAASEALSSLSKEVSNAIKSLHWKDFESLVDLLFRNAGWRRLSVLGETMKYADLELEEPITGDRYQVQIKSKAGAAEFKAVTSSRDKVFASSSLWSTLRSRP